MYTAIVSRHTYDSSKGHVIRTVVHSIQHADLSAACFRENEAEEVKEEGAKEMTLDEWKAQQDKERAKVEFNLRKANEGTDWNKGYLLHKSKTKDVSQQGAC